MKSAINSKINSILCFVSLFFVLIIVRLLYLQMYCSDYFLLRSQKNFIRYEMRDAVRGNILDIHGHLLATNRPCACVMWQGSGAWSLSNDQLNAVHLLDQILGKECSTGELFENIKTAERKHQQVVLATDIDSSTLSKIAELFPHNPNIVIETQFKRFYPYHTSAAHVVGYLGNIRMAAHGQSGLEKICNEDLSGQKGETRHVVNSAGKKLSQTPMHKESSGADIQTTIDIALQQLVEKVFPEHHSGCFIVLNPEDGDILALASRPSFDPNIFLDSISLDTWSTLQQRNSFLNRAFDAQYPSGSVFKLITISAALEQNIISPDMIWNCKGYTLFGNRKYWCGRKSGHGDISIAQAVATSCNTLFFEIGKHIDIDVLADYARIFGLGEKTASILPEKAGLVPNREWKYACKGEQWWPGETLSVTIGQSFLLVTPMQIARMIASIFTGYLVSPRLLVNEPIVKNELAIQPETLSFLKKSMKMAVRSGTGRGVNTIKDIKIYGKTSTAQTSDLKKRYLDPKYLEHGWFVVHFQYKDYAPLVLVVIVERVGASQVATTIAKNFLIEYKNYMN